MGLRGLQELKKNTRFENKREQRFFRHLIFGDDIYAYQLYSQLISKYGESEVALISSSASSFSDSSRDDLIPRGPSPFRGEENLAFFTRHFPELEISSEIHQSKFLKDGSFRAFGGRSKSEKLLEGESFYTQESKALLSRCAYEKIFPLLANEQELQKLKQKSLHDILLKLHIIDYSNDLIQNGQWIFEGGSGVDYSCEWLYWCESPQLFLDSLEEKNKLSDKQVELIEASFSPCTLHYRMELDLEPNPELYDVLKEYRESLFIPLSLTHDWGHFIGEFQCFLENKTRKMNAEFLSFVEKEATTEEEISKKFRLFKKNLEKVFPQITSYCQREWLVLSQKNECQNIDDSFVDEFKQKPLNVRFAGPHAPLERSQEEAESLGYSICNLSSLARGVCSLQAF